MFSKVSENELQRRSKYWALYHESILKESSLGNLNTLDVTTESSISAISGRILSNDPPQMLDFDLHSHWSTVLLAAQNFDVDNPKQDTLVRQTMYARQIGILSREICNEDGSPTLAQTSNGQKIWADLPFLVQDTVQLWCQESLEMPEDKRRNLASFIARLVGVGICGLSLTGCVLLLFRRTLEIPRRPTASVEGSDVPIEHLLPAIHVFLQFCPWQIAEVVEQSFHEFDDVTLKMSAPGELAIHANIHDGGFSPARWAFWKTRLTEIVQPDAAPMASVLLKLMDDIQSREL